MQKRIIIRIISYLLAGILVFAGIIIKYLNELKFYKNQARYTYSQAFTELSESMDNININLKKAKYVTTEKQIKDIASTVYTESKIAKAAFAKFPSSDKYGENLNKFLSQVGNYAVFLSRKIGSGGSIETMEKSNLEKLGSLADKISKNVITAYDNYTADENTIQIIEQKIAENFEENELSLQFLELNESLTDYPTLLYDGPYSDYVALKKSELLENAEFISKETAMEKLSELFGVEKEKIRFKAFESDNIASYHFSFGECSAAISQKGGYLVYYRKYTPEQPALYSYEQAKSKARKIISSILGENFIPTYYFTDNGVCVINFAYKNGAAICYPDLIKIGIDLHSGDMVLYESRGYLTNHTVRTLVTPKYTIGQAQEVLSEKLTVKSYALAVIPTSGGYEKQCWEFVCKTDENSEIIVYIDTENLSEEAVFMLLNVSGGTLVK